jgi:hypothetical protein
MPSLIVVDMQNKWLKLSLVNLHHSPSVMLHFEARFPCQALIPNTYNSYSEANLTKVGFGNGGHCFATFTNLSHSR